MLTRCPRCGTTFRVTPEHLKIRQGRVRCGACQGVFNALESLAEERPAATVHPQVAAGSEAAPTTRAAADPVHHAVPEAATEPAPPPAAPPEPEPVPAIAPELATLPKPEAAPEALVGAQPPATPPAGIDAGLEPEPAPVAESAWEPPTEPGPPGEPAAQPAAQPTAQPTTAPPPESLAAATEATEPPPSEALPDEDTYPQPSRWPWALGSLVALAILAIQALVYFRVELAVAMPEAKPALGALCHALGCDLPLPSRVELMGIETSDLHPDPAGNGGFQLMAGLRNRAPFAQVWPYLELTLTDANDRALVRRAVAPSEYLPADVRVANGFPARSDQAIRLAVQAPGVAAIGYRLYVFYP